MPFPRSKIPIARVADETGRPYAPTDETNLALFTQTIDSLNLVLGVGRLILGVWGIRSVMAPTPTVTTADLSLSGVHLFLLLALAVRAELSFHSRSGVLARR